MKKIASILIMVISLTHCGSADMKSDLGAGDLLINGLSGKQLCQSWVPTYNENDEYVGCTHTSFLDGQILTDSDTRDRISENGCLSVEGMKCHPKKEGVISIEDEIENVIEKDERDEQVLLGS